MDSGLGDHIRAAMLWHPFDSEKKSNKEIHIGMKWRKTATVILFLDVSGKHMMDRRTIGEDEATGVSCSLNPAAWQAIRTPDLWLEQRSFAPQSTGSRISERDDCAESESSKRFRGVSSVDDAPGTEWVNE